MLQDRTGCQIRLWSVKFADQSVVSPGGFQTVSTCHIRLLSAPNLSLLPLCLKSQLPPAMWLLHCCTDLSNYAALQGHHPCWYWEPSVHLYREPMHRGYILNSTQPGVTCSWSQRIASLTSAAFNTVILDKLPLKLHNMVLSTSMCSWIKDFLTGRPQVMRIRDCTSATVCSAQLSHDCSVIHCSNTFVKFADTTIEGLMSDNETLYREEPLYLPLLCLPLQQRSKPGVKMNPGSI